YMPDVIEMAIDQGGMRLRFVDCVVHVEHRAHSRATDFFDQRHRLGQCLHNVRLGYRKGFDQHGDAAVLGLLCYRCEPVDVVPGGLLTSESTGGGALVWRAKYHDSVVSEVRAEVDKVANMLPASFPQSSVRSGYVQALGTDHQPVKAHELQPFGA